MAGQDSPGLTAVAGGQFDEAPDDGSDGADWTRSDGRKFGLLMGGAFLVLAAVLWWRGHPTLLWTAGGLAVVVGAAGVVVPGRLKPVYDAWMAVARAISKVTTPLVLGLLYYGVITPAGLIRRHVGGSPLRREERDGSYWVSRDASDRSDLRRQF